MKRYRISGMSCAACAARIERAVSAVKGVSGCSVNLLTNSMGVEGDAEERDVIRAVTDAGYGASPADDAAFSADALADRETPAMRKRLLIGLAFLLPLLYGSMGHRMWGLPLPAFLEENPLAAGLFQLLSAACVLLLNGRLFRSGAKGALHRAPNMDTLVALGSFSSFAWSVYALFMMGGALRRGDAPAAAEWSNELYFDSAAMILVLIGVGKLLEAKSKGRTTDALRELMRLAPETATLVLNGEERVVPVGELKAGDVFAVRPGERFPADGLVLSGDTAVDEAALTGESIPVDKTAGDTVSAATVNQSGYVLCRATQVGETTALAQIIRAVSDAAATKAPIARLADRVSAVFVPTVVGIAAVTLTVWLLLGQSFSFALARAVSVLVISCPCALGLATPVAVTVGSGVGARRGILFKTAASLEAAGKNKIVVLDKTGTVTKGKPELAFLCPAPGVSEEELLRAACSVEAKSEHPLAGAVIREAEKRGITPLPVTDFKAFPGSGVSACAEGVSVCGGSLRFMAGRVPFGEEIRDEAEALADKGCTPLLFARGDRPLGLLAVADEMKEDSPAAVEELKELGLLVVLLTGDTERTARSVARRAGIENVAAGVLPTEKAAIVRRLQTLGAVAMIGDGINDAPALTAADTGMAIGAGTDIAIDAADVVLLNSSLRDAAAAIRLSRATLRSIRENLFWAFFYNALCIPLAAGCWYGLWGITLHPMTGAAAMSLSSLCVVMNALRLNGFRNDPKKGGGREKPADGDALARLTEELERERRNKKMQKTVRIEGMMCTHCEAHIRQALEAIDGVADAVADSRAGEARLTLTREVGDDELRSAVEQAGYTFLGAE